MKRTLLSTIFIVLLSSVCIYAQRGNNRPPARNGNPGMQNGNSNSQNRAGRMSGQQNPNSNARENRRGPRIFRGLDLSDDQKIQIRDIQSAARENGTDRQTVNGQIREVLTEEQAEIFDRRLEKDRRRREKQKGENPPPPAENENNQSNPPI